MTRYTSTGVKFKVSRLEVKIYILTNVMLADVFDAWSQTFFIIGSNRTYKGTSDDQLQ